MASQNSKSKGLLIRRALSKAKVAQTDGFYLEVVALTDSIITECLSRIQLHSAGTATRIRGLKSGIRQIIESDVVLIDASLVQDSLNWGNSRNSAIHGFTKLHEYDGQNWEQRTIMLKEQSAIGLKLAQRWLKEASKHKL